jgi:membrane fusion protein, multidrug efflux system
MKFVMKYFVRSIMYLALPVFFIVAFYVMSLIPSSSAQKSATLEAVKKEAPLKRIQSVEIIPQPLQETVLLPGTVEAYEDVNVSAGIPGIIEEVYVKEGDRVKKGKELFQIDLRSRTARVEDAKAAHELAKKSLERKKILNKRGDVTVQEYDEAISQERRASAVMRTAQVEVSLGHIEAPMDGIIDKIDVEKGEYAHEGSQLARLLSMDKVKVVVGVPELYADAISHEKEAMVHLEALGEIQPARIERLAFEANAQTNTFEATLVMENPEYRIRPGMIIRAEITTKRVDEALIVPLMALMKRASGMSVFVEKDGVVHSRPVKLGAFKKDRIEITDGLKPHERVVVVGQQDLVDDQKVQVMETSIIFNTNTDNN